jgi:hypothetical protein
VRGRDGTGRTHGEEAGGARCARAAGTTAGGVRRQRGNGAEAGVTPENLGAAAQIDASTVMATMEVLPPTTRLRRAEGTARHLASIHRRRAAAGGERWNEQHRRVLQGVTW